LIQLVVSDGLAASTNTITVTVLIPGLAVERLIAMVEREAPKPQPLVATLRAALEAIHRGNLTTAVNQMQAFQNKVHAQVAPGNPTLAQVFTQAAQEIIDTLICLGAKSHPHAKVKSVSRDADGKARLQCSGEPGGMYVIEASSNLRDWETIGAAAAASDGTFQFEDRSTTTYRTRFYRVVAP
jgi:hypothetical protein